MKNRNYNIFILLALIISISWSCSKDFLIEEPTTAIPADDAFDLLTTAEAARNGVYDQLSAYTFEGLYVPLMSDVMGEDLMISPDRNLGWFVTVYQLDVLPNYFYTDDPWWAAYKVIYDANRLVANAKNIKDASDEEKNNLEAEGKVLRAFTMLKLAQMYAPAYSVDPTAPSIMNVTIPTDANSENFARAPLSEVYNQIVTDLNSAIDLFSDVDTDYRDAGFFDKKGAHAVLARAYLDMEEWENASNHAKLAYEGLELMNSNELVYGGFNRRNSETIFTVAYTQEDNNTYLSIPSFYWPEFGYSSIRANDKFVELYEVTDARQLFFVLHEPIDADRNLILKFAHNAAVGNAELISIRASEMYLIEAECEAELGNNALAQDALFKIQERSITNASKSKATGQELIDEILLERRKELCGEGFRWNDIKRRNLPFKREGDHWSKFDFSAEDEDYYRFTFPIPQSEIDANPLINEENQNTGY